MTTNGKHDPLSYPDFLKPYLEVIKAKIPAGWIEKPTRKGGGWRWIDPNNKTGTTQIRIDPGRLSVSMQTQQTDHVVVQENGIIIGREGIKIRNGIESDPLNAHVPLLEWLSWRYWNSP